MFLFIAWAVSPYLPGSRCSPCRWAKIIGKAERSPEVAPDSITPFID